MVLQSNAPLSHALAPPTSTAPAEIDQHGHMVTPQLCNAQAAKLAFSTLSNVAPVITSANVSDLLQTPQGHNQGTLRVAANASAMVLYIILDANAPQPTSAQVLAQSFCPICGRALLLMKRTSRVLMQYSGVQSLPHA